MRHCSLQLSLLMSVLYKDILIFPTDSCGCVDVGKGKPRAADWCQFWLGPLASWGLRQKSSAHM